MLDVFSCHCGSRVHPEPERLPAPHHQLRVWKMLTLWPFWDRLSKAINCSFNFKDEYDFSLYSKVDRMGRLSINSLSSNNFVSQRLRVDVPVLFSNLLCFVWTGPEGSCRTLSFLKNQKSRTLKTQNSLEYFVKIEQYYAFGIKSFLLSTCNYHKLSWNCKLNISIQERKGFWVLKTQSGIWSSLSLLGYLEKDFPPCSLSAATEVILYSQSWI